MSTPLSTNGNSNANGLSSSSPTASSVPPQYDNISRASGSEFSLSPSAGDTEVSQEKFSRLVSEYSKVRSSKYSRFFYFSFASFSNLFFCCFQIRSQFAVLRKAYVDEKNKTQKCEDQLKQCEQDIRKLVQETESLNFRNTQLSKRVGVLQNDLEETGPKPRSFFNFSPDTSASKPRTLSNASTVSGHNVLVGAIDNELFQELNQQLKDLTMENDKLKSEIDSLESKLAEEGAISAKKLKDSNAQKEEDIAQLNLQVKKLTNSLEKNKNERSDLENSLKNLTTKFENLEANSQKQITDLNEQLRRRLADSVSPASSLLSVSDIPRSGSFSGDIRNRFSPNLGPRTGSLSLQRRSNIQKPSTSKTEDMSQRIPSYSSSAYQNESFRNEICDQFSSKILELICAFSTVHSSFSKKISVLFAMLNNEDYHYYFNFMLAPMNSSDNKEDLGNVSLSLRIIFFLNICFIFIVEPNSSK